MAASCLHISALILSCFILFNSVTDAIFSMDETCIYYSEGYIADPSNCAGWGYCRGGKVIAKGNCTGDYLYSSATGSCADAKTADCGLNVASLCDNEPAAHKADPTNCKGYCYCQNSVNMGCAICDGDLIFNPNIKECVYASTYNCPIDSACSLVPNNKFVADPDPAKCGNYLRCVNGASPTSSACADGLIYNPANGFCDSYTSLNCSGTSKPDETLSQAEINKLCASYDAAGAANQFMSDGLTCGKFIGCTSATTGTWQSCYPGTHFDLATQQCVSPASVKCAYDRCNNLKLDFVTADSTKCGSYVICEDGKAKGTTITALPCTGVSTKFPYFDEIAGGCVEEIPTYPICT